MSNYKNLQAKVDRLNKKINKLAGFSNEKLFIETFLKLDNCKNLEDLEAIVEDLEHVKLTKKELFMLSLMARIRQNSIIVQLLDESIYDIGKRRSEMFH